VESRAATLALVLGSSLQITPSCNLPDKTIRGGKGLLAIVNLQATPKVRGASAVARYMSAHGTSHTRSQV
jgi:mono-ADP-ribosyltransferase sirtuin 6